MFPGDVFMLNYPYWSAAHTLDVLVFCPIFAEEKLLGFASCRVHLLDLKQRDAGYVLDSTDMSQEGIFFPSVKLYERGKIRQDIFNIIRFNSRFPERTIGDLQAEVSAVHTGDVRMREIAEKYGVDVLVAAMEEISDARRAPFTRRSRQAAQGHPGRRSTTSTRTEWISTSSSR